MRWLFLPATLLLFRMVIHPKSWSLRTGISWQRTAEFFMRLWFKELQSINRASDRHARRHAAAVAWTCLSSLWQNLCIGLRSPQLYSYSSTTAQLTLHQCNFIVEINQKQANTWHRPNVKVCCAVYNAVKSRISSSLASHLRTIRGVTKIWCQTILLAAWHKRAHPALTPAGVSW